MNKSPVPSVVISAIALTAFVASMGSFAFYKINALQEENLRISSEIEERKQAQEELFDEPQTLTNEVIKENEKEQVAEVQNESPEPSVDWESVISVLPVMSDTLKTYKASYESMQTIIETNRNHERETLNLLAETSDPIDRKWLQQLYIFTKEYRESGIRFSVWLDTSVTYYQRFINSINSRDASEYIVTIEFIKEHETEKESLANDLMQKEQTKIDFVNTAI
jgi:hypothetical protein